jgi:6-phosphofructokinase 1
MKHPSKRIGINLGGRYVPGLNTILHGVTRAAEELGWEVLGIRDGYEGLLFPERYPDGGVVRLTSALLESVTGATGCLLGTASRVDPFNVRTVNADHAVEEVDQSDKVVAWASEHKIAAMISILDAPELSLPSKLQRKGLKTVCVPKSAENQIASTMLAFGYNSVLSFAVEMLERATQAAQSARKIGIVEVLGEEAGWLALQAGTAVCAEAILIPEIPYDLTKVALQLNRRLKEGRNHGLVIVAEGARPAAFGGGRSVIPDHPLKAVLAPGATGVSSEFVIQGAGHAAQAVALELQRLVSHSTYSLVLGPLVRGGPPTAVDRQLGMGYGAAAVKAIQEQRDGVMVAFQPPELTFVPVAEALNKVRTVSKDSVFMQVARSLGIALGD